jgi:hypothetical protein
VALRVAVDGKIVIPLEVEPDSTVATLEYSLGKAVAESEAQNALEVAVDVETVKPLGVGSGSSVGEPGYSLDGVVILLQAAVPPVPLAS